MTIVDHEFVDLSTPSGQMRTFVFRPADEARHPGIILFSEIFQATGPIRRTAAMLAGHGYTVAVPEIFHEFEPAGTALAYDSAGADRGNWCKVNKPLEHYDADAKATIDFLAAHPHCDGQLGTAGICIGGHLSFRCAMHSGISAGVCFYPTDLHKLPEHPRGLGTGMADDSLARAEAGDLHPEMLFIWGRQDPHIPFAGRQQIREALEKGGVSYQWLEFNAAHAFIRDEGPRYDPELASLCMSHVLALFHRTLGSGTREPSAHGHPAGR
jgi:carboxymethylenebutenolidase